MFEGDANANACNRSVKIEILSDTKAILKIRLSEEQSLKRMEAKASLIGMPIKDFVEGKDADISSLRMKCRWIEVELIFDGKRQKQKLAELKAIIEARSQYVKEIDGKKKNIIKPSIPVTWTISYEWVSIKNKNKEIEKQRRFKFRAFWQKEVSVFTDIKNGVLGVDVNAWGLALCQVKPDGNIAKKSGNKYIKSINIDWLNKNSNQSLHAVRLAVKEVVSFAGMSKCPIVLEDLNFS